MLFQPHRIFDCSTSNSHCVRGRKKNDTKKNRDNRDLPLYVASSWESLGHQVSLSCWGTWLSSWLPLLAMGWHSSPGSPGEMTHKKSKTENSIADVVSCFFFFSSTLSAGEHLFMWQVLIKWSPRNPKNATSSAKIVCQQVQPQSRPYHSFEILKLHNKIL